MTPLVRLATASDVPSVAAIHREAFPRQRDSEVWVAATLSAAPRMLCFVAEHESEQIVGYVFWAQKSGIRSSAVLELDQIAIRSQFRGTSIAKHLIKESLGVIKSELKKNQQIVKSVLVSTRSDNQAQRLYAQVLGAKVIATIDGLYSGTEVLMLGQQADA